jgi:hypothetical protein
MASISPAIVFMPFALLRVQSEMRTASTPYAPNAPCAPASPPPSRGTRAGGAAPGDSTSLQRQWGDGTLAVPPVPVKRALAQAFSGPSDSGQEPAKIAYGAEISITENLNFTARDFT